MEGVLGHGGGDVSEGCPVGLPFPPEVSVGSRHWFQPIVTPTVQDDKYMRLQGNHPYTVNTDPTRRDADFDAEFSHILTNLVTWGGVELEGPSHSPTRMRAAEPMSLLLKPRVTVQLFKDALRIVASRGRFPTGCVRESVEDWSAAH